MVIPQMLRIDIHIGYVVHTQVHIMHLRHLADILHNYRVINILNKIL